MSESTEGSCGFLIECKMKKGTWVYGNKDLLWPRPSIIHTSTLQKCALTHTGKCVCLHKHFSVIPPHVLTDISPMERLFKLKWALLHPYIYSASKRWHEKTTLFHKTKTIALKGMNNDLRLMISCMSCFHSVTFHWKHPNQNCTFNLSANYEKPVQSSGCISHQGSFGQKAGVTFDHVQWPSNPAVLTGQHLLRAINGSKINITCSYCLSEVLKTLSLGNLHFLFVTNGTISLPPFFKTANTDVYRARWPI